MVPNARISTETVRARWGGEENCATKELVRMVSGDLSARKRANVIATTQRCVIRGRASAFANQAGTARTAQGCVLC
jgi:hypothetical protein